MAVSMTVDGSSDVVKIVVIEGSVVSMLRDVVESIVVAPVEESASTVDDNDGKGGSDVLVDIVAAVEKSDSVAEGEFVVSSAVVNSSSVGVGAAVDGDFVVIKRASDVDCGVAVVVSANDSSSSHRSPIVAFGH